MFTNRETMGRYFSAAALKFMRGLRRHNDRLWFNERKDVYLEEVHKPMMLLCDDVSASMADFAADHIKPSNKVMMRIYENMRFHSYRKPFKNHLGAWWGRAGMERTSGAGYYFHFGATEFEIAAGCFMPLPEQLLAIRRSIAKNPRPLRKLLANRKRQSLLPNAQCGALKTAPKGFSASDPAIDLLRCRKWGAYVELSPDVALSPNLLNEIVTRFRAASPLIEYLNAPLIRRTESINRHR